MPAADILPVIATMLNLPQLKQTGLVEDPLQYQVHVTCDVPIPECGCLIPKLVRNGTKKVMFMDTPMHGKKVGIWVARQRYLCQSCRKTIYADVPHMHIKHDMTERLVSYIEQSGTARTFTALASEIGIDSQTISGIWNSYARQELDKIGPVTPEWLGIDELHIMGAYRAVITNIKERTLVDMLPNRKKATIIAYLGAVMESDKIKVVTMDMWDDYREAVKIALPHAKIVVDRFHVMQHASKAVEMVRKSLRANLNFKKRIGLIGDRWLFLSARENLSAQQTLVLEAVLEQYPTIKQAYQLKESFRDVWTCSDRATAESRYGEWKTRVDASDASDAFKPLLTAMENWRVEIFNYMDTRLTNAYTESFNSLARKMDRMGRGYSFPVLRAKLLMMNSCHKRGAPIPFRRSAPPVASTMMLSAPSPPEDEWAMLPGRFLGLDISTLAEELGKLPEN